MAGVARTPAGRARNKFTDCGPGLGECRDVATPCPRHAAVSRPARTLRRQVPAPTSAKPQRPSTVADAAVDAGTAHPHAPGPVRPPPAGRGPRASTLQVGAAVGHARGLGGLPVHVLARRRLVPEGIQRAPVERIVRARRGVVGEVDEGRAVGRRCGAAAQPERVGQGRREHLLPLAPALQTIAVRQAERARHMAERIGRVGGDRQRLREVVRQGTAQVVAEQRLRRIGEGDQLRTADADQEGRAAARAGLQRRGKGVGPGRPTGSGRAGRVRSWTVAR